MLAVRPWTDLLRWRIFSTPDVERGFAEPSEP